MKPKVRQIMVIIKDSTLKYLTTKASKMGYKKLGRVIDDIVDADRPTLYESSKRHRKRS